MLTVTLHLAEPAQSWIEARVASGEWPDAASYVAALVEQDRGDAKKLAALKSAVDEGLASGISELTLGEIFERAMARHVDA